jgi:hypothetical protein
LESGCSLTNVCKSLGGRELTSFCHDAGDVKTSFFDPKIKKPLDSRVFWSQKPNLAPRARPKSGDRVSFKFSKNGAVHWMNGASRYAAINVLCGRRNLAHRTAEFRDPLFAGATGVASASLESYGAPPMCWVSASLHITRNRTANTSATSKALAIQTLAAPVAPAAITRVTLAQTLAQFNKKIWAGMRLQLWPPTVPKLVAGDRSAFAAEGHGIGAD